MNDTFRMILLGRLRAKTTIFPNVALPTGKSEFEDKMRRKKSQVQQRAG